MGISMWMLEAAPHQMYTDLNLPYTTFWKICFSCSPYISQPEHHLSICPGEKLEWYPLLLHLINYPPNPYPVNPQILRSYLLNSSWNCLISSATLRAQVLLCLDYMIASSLTHLHTVLPSGLRVISNLPNGSYLHCVQKPSIYPLLPKEWSLDLFGVKYKNLPDLASSNLSNLTAYFPTTKLSIHFMFLWDILKSLKVIRDPLSLKEIW